MGRRVAAAVAVLLCSLGGAGSAAAETVPTRHGAGLFLGGSYNPGGVAWALASGFALFDYDAVWPHRAPENLRFKVEAAAGVAERDGRHPVASAGILALTYLDWPRLPGLRPYAEAGIGAIYTGFRVRGQGLHWNFNPQAGVGVEGDRGFAVLRLHHLSNANLHPDNRGINSAALLVGVYF